MTTPIPAPLPADAVRDLAADYAICEAAPAFGELVCLDDDPDDLHYFKRIDGEKWHIPAYTVEGVDTLGDHECGAMELPAATFIAMARTALPAYIRLLAAERLENGRLRTALRADIWKFLDGDQGRCQ